MNMIQQAAKLYEARETLQALHGAEYLVRITPWMDGIKRIMASRGIDSPLTAAIEICNKIRRDGSLDGLALGARLLHVLAAAVEIMEPSEVPA